MNDLNFEPKFLKISRAQAETFAIPLKEYLPKDVLEGGKIQASLIDLFYSLDELASPEVCEK